MIRFYWNANGSLKNIPKRRNVRLCGPGLLFYHPGLHPFPHAPFYPLIQATPLVNRSDLLSLVVQMVPDTLDGLVVYVLDSLHSNSPMAPFVSHGHCSPLVLLPGMLSIEAGA